MNKTILLTGATGNVGKYVVEELSRLGILHYTATHREPSTSKERKLDFQDTSTFESALEGIETLFLMRPPHISNVQKYFHPFLDSVKEKGVKHVVFLSLQGAENNTITPHRKIELYIEKLGIPYTFIRPSFFMQNLTTTHLEEIRDRHEIFIPAGKGKTNFIDTRDIGEVIAKVLAEGEPHIGTSYELTGTTSYTYYEVAELLSQITGKRISYTSPGMFTFYRKKKKEGLAPSFILVMIALYTVARLGKADATTSTFQELTGHEPISLEEFVRDYKDTFA